MCTILHWPVYSSASLIRLYYLLQFVPLLWSLLPNISELPCIVIFFIWISLPGIKEHFCVFVGFVFYCKTTFWRRVRVRKIIYIWWCWPPSGMLFHLLKSSIVSFSNVLKFYFYIPSTHFSKCFVYFSYGKENLFFHYNYLRHFVIENFKHIEKRENRIMKLLVLITQLQKFSTHSQFHFIYPPTLPSTT